MKNVPNEVDRKLNHRTRTFWIIFSVVGIGFISIIGLLVLMATPRPIAPQTAGANDGMRVVNIYIEAEGVYDLRLDQLAKLGLQAEKIKSQNIHLFLRGQEQPLYFLAQGGDSRLRFYGIPSESRYSPVNIYQLVSGGEVGSMLLDWNEESTSSPMVGQETSAKSALARVKIEENLLYYPQVIEGDHWFWNQVSIGQQNQYNINLDYPSPGGGRIQVAVWGSTESSVDPDHHLRISMNGLQVIDFNWDGVGRQIIEGVLPNGLITEGVNTITIQTPGDTKAAAENNLVDWIALDYPRQTIANGDRIEFWDSNTKVQLSGFSGSVTIVDVTNPQAVIFMGEYLPQEGELVFRGDMNHRYLAIGPDGFLKPIRIKQAVSEPNLTTTGLGAEYLAIGPQDLLDALQPLVEWRSQQGLKVLLIPLEAIFDQFGNGFPEPEAIREFLKYTSDAWVPAPKYILLVGDTTYDTRGYLSGPEANRLPTFFVQTEYGGETASDVMFAMLDEDQLPDLAIGRVPASQPEQITVWVEKTLAYEKNLIEEDQFLPVLAIADGQDPQFTNDAQHFLDQLSSVYETELFTPLAGTMEADKTITEYFNQGFFLISYFGHGSVNMWGKDRLFTSEDVTTLSNQHLPIVVNMTCLNGLFTHPKVESMTEAFLWQPEGGAVAVLAPTSLTLTYDQSVLSGFFAEAIAERSPHTIGEILLITQRQLSVYGSGARDVLLTFLLFGDPGLSIFNQPDK